MDALALLCTLHADGPATLKRFRHAGCTSLEELRALDLERLASLLGTSPAAAKRFLREAQSLGERVGRGLLDREDQGIAPRAVPSGASPATGGDAIEGSDEHRRPSLGAREREIVDKVLETWRERDQQESTWNDPDPAVAPRAETEPRSTIGTALKPGAIDGLDEHTSALLAALDIGDLESLARIDVLDISRRTGIGYTKLARLRFLAARDVSSGSAPLTARRSGAEPRSGTDYRSGTTTMGDAKAARAPQEKFSMSEKPPEASWPILDVERDLHAGPRAPLPVGSSWARSPLHDAQSERSTAGEHSPIGRQSGLGGQRPGSSGERPDAGERAGGPFV